MLNFNRLRRHLSSLLFALLLVCHAFAGIGALRAQPDQPFSALPGRWVGEGRLGFKSGAIEAVKCRATYFVSVTGETLNQNIRCASASGKVELKSTVTHKGGELSGSWEELIYNLNGEIEGMVTPRGFRVKVKGKGLAANMEIITKDERQIVEVHFDSETLIGMTLLLKKG